MKTVEILGVEIDSVTEAEALAKIREAIESGKRLQVVTVNNEMIMAAQKDAELKKIINSAGLRVPDTAGTVWASHFQAQKRGGYVRAVGSLLRLLFAPQSVRTELPGTVPGSDLTVALAGMSEEFGYGLFLLGGWNGGAERAAAELKKQFPKLKVAGTLSDVGPRDEECVLVVKKAKPQVVLVAFGHGNQEKWIHQQVATLKAPVVAVGVGGTIDYLAGDEKAPPAFVRRVGLEWFWRLVTQPRRLGRIMTALPLFVRQVVRSKR